MIRTIVCTGDSHTWGQGASLEAQNNLNPPVMAGDLRPLPFDQGDYVSLLRKRVSQETSSFYGEISAEKFAGIDMYENCAIVESRPLTIEKPANLFRIFFKCQSQPSTAAVYLDGQKVKIVELQAEKITNAYVQIPVFAEGDTCHRLEIQTVTGTVLVYRLEWYSGTYAVINSGIGSCPSKQFGKVFWDSYVAAYQPAILVMEAHTINDWLTGESTEVYRQQLAGLLRQGKTTGAEVLMVTVPQILGEQMLPSTAAPYDEFVAASRQAAEDEQVPIADVNQVFRNDFNATMPDQREQALFSDPWHVTSTGHQLYAQTIWEWLHRKIL